MICESYVRESEPDICKSFDRDMDYEDSSVLTDSSNVGMIVGIVLGSIVAIILFLWCLKRSLKRGFKTNINSSV